MMDETSGTSTNTPVAGKEWNAAGYDQKNSFVWKLGAGVIELLAPRPGERILDLGCGTGHLTNQIASTGATTLGIDTSPTMIDEARKLYPALRFEIGDGTSFHFDEPFDAVFSNAAIHWMKDQKAVAVCVWRALKPGGRFVAEFGGKGNIQALRSSLSNAIRAAGYAADIESFARYYPTIGEYSTLLESAGFRVTFASHFERPTKLEGGEQGFANWIETFADNVLDLVPREMRADVIRDAARQARDELFRDGTWFADYRRIRIAAIK